MTQANVSFSWRLFRLPSLIVLFCVLFGVPHSASGPQTQPYPEIQAVPMTFFVAKGVPDACGVGCSEWIAAEGWFDPGADTRFREFLGTLNGRNLPIFFNSPGGFIGQATAVGRLLRDHRLPVSVGQTIPDECGAGHFIDDCRTAVTGKASVPAKLRTKGANCHSACVYAFIGGVARDIPVGARIGVHSPMLSSPSSPDLDSEQPDNDRKLYTVLMGVEPSLVEETAKIPHEKIHVLSRSEIERFGIQIKKTFQTGWLLYKDRSQRISAISSITTLDRANSHYRTHTIRVRCAGPQIGVWLSFRSNFDESAKLQVASGPRIVALGAGASDTHVALVDWDFMRESISQRSLEFGLMRQSGTKDPRSHEIRVSTDGLVAPFTQITRDCGAPTL